MTRIIAKAYRMADEALGRIRRSAPRDALREADEAWPRIVEDAARGTLKDVYTPMDEYGQVAMTSVDSLGFHATLSKNALTKWS